MGDAHPFRERYPSVLRRLQRCMVFNQNSEDVQEDNRKAERVCAAPHDPEHAFHGCDIIEDGDRVQDFKAMAADPAAVQAQKSRTEHFGKLPGNQLLSEKRRTFTLRDCSFDTLRTPGQITELQGTQKKVDTGASSWLRRTVNTTFRRHKRPLNSTAIPQLTNKHCVSISSLCAPQLDMDTPNQSLNPPGGAAARAAAAAQNEILESARLLTMQDNLRLVQPKVSNDSESGIGIDLREPSDDMDLTLPIMRTGV